MLSEFLPVVVSGDGNCLFRSASVAMYDTEEHHELLRLHTAIEIALYPEWYDSSQPSFRSSLREDRAVIFSPYHTLFKEVTTDGSCSDVATISALSAVLKAPIDMYFPPLGLAGVHPLSSVVIGRGVERAEPPIRIMWSTNGEVNLVELVRTFQKKIIL